MKYSAVLMATCLVTMTAPAEIIPFALSPSGSSPATGLSPANEVPAVGAASEGSGDKILSGINFDTDTRELSFAVGYGSIASFTDLTGPATAAHIHGPASVTESASPIHNFVTAGQHLPAGNPAKGGVILGTVVLDETQAQALLDGLYYINIHTAANPGGEIRGQLIAQINTAATVTCPESVEVECEGDDGTTVNLTVQVADPDGDELTVVWTIDGVVYQTDTVPATDGGTDASVHFTGQFGYGTHEVNVSVSDGTAEPATCTTSVTVVDTLPPEVTAVTPSQSVLWPPNHKMIPIRISVTASDVCGDVVSRITNVTSDEPVNDKGDGNTAPDWQVTGNLSLLLRAERAGPGDGRVYTITVETTDHAGHTVTNTTEVRVPHDMRRDVYVPEAPGRAPKSRANTKSTATSGTATSSSTKTSASRVVW